MLLFFFSLFLFCRDLYRWIVATHCLFFFGVLWNNSNSLFCILCLVFCFMNSSQYSLCKFGLFFSRSTLQALSLISTLSCTLPSLLQNCLWRLLNTLRSSLSLSISRSHDFLVDFALKLLPKDERDTSGRMLSLTNQWWDEVLKLQKISTYLNWWKFRLTKFSSSSIICHL